MGYITTPLFNILRTSGEDISTPSGIYEACMKTVFDTDGILAPIKESHRVRLVTGFGLHYFRDEIGQETVPLFKMTVNEKIWNNAEELNAIFDNLDKQIYNRYAVHHAEHADQNADSTIASELSNLNEISNGSSVDSNSLESVGSRVHADAQNNKSEVLSNEAGSNSAQHKSNASANDSSSNSNNELSQDNTVSHDNSLDSNSRASNTVSDTESDSNSVSATLDTPQGSINAIRTPQGGTPVSLKGAGVDAEVVAPYRYLTSGASSDGTSVGHDISKLNEAGNTQHSGDSDSTVNGNRQSSGASNSLHNEEQNANDSQSSQRQAQTQSNDNMQSSGSEENRQNTSSEAQRQDSNQKQAIDDRQRQENKTGSANGQEDSVDYELTTQMLNDYIPLMARVWKIFDPCFCMLLD